jgi:hypothetical protein
MPTFQPSAIHRESSNCALSECCKQAFELVAILLYLLYSDFRFCVLRRTSSDSNPAGSNLCGILISGNSRQKLQVKQAPSPENRLSLQNLSEAFRS